MSDALILKRRNASRSSGQWSDDDYDVLSDGELVGRIYCDTAVSSDAVRWFWALAYGHHEARSPTHGRAPTREDAMAAFAKSWRRV